MLKQLNIPPEKFSPEISLSPDGIFKITGRSIHENIIKFFEPINQWIIEYMEDPADVTCVDMNLEYVNSASAKVLMNLLEMISHVRLKNKEFIFNWYYEEGDDDILERGEYFASILNVPFNFIVVKNRSSF